MTHPLSTQALIERAATASNEPDLHHVEAAFRSARALALTSDHDHAADVAALEMALASAATLARRIYDHDDGLEDWLHRILAHFADDFGRIVGELERLADNDGDPAYRSDPADFVTP